MKKRNNQQQFRRIYAMLLSASEIPIIETPDIHSKGLLLLRNGRYEVYIKKSLPIREKLKVLLHEYNHYIHLTHYFQNETRSECEIIANGAAFFVCGEYGLNICKVVDLTKFSDDAGIVARLTAAIQAVSGHILGKMSESN